MNPRNGRWVGTYTGQDSPGGPIELDLTFQGGRVQGTFTVNRSPGQWHGPQHGDLFDGSYTPDGTIRFSTNAGSMGTARFSGQYTVEEITGPVTITKGSTQENGSLSVRYGADAVAGAAAVGGGATPAIAPHVWSE